MRQTKEKPAREPNVPPSGSQRTKPKAKARESRSVLALHIDKDPSLTYAISADKHDKTRSEKHGSPKTMAGHDPYVGPETSLDAFNSPVRKAILQRAIEVFGSEQKARTWFFKKIRALGGHTPFSLLDKPVSRQEILDVLTRVEDGALY